MIAARQIAFGRGGKRLPYLRRVAYLESHGMEWIDYTDLCGQECPAGTIKFIPTKSNQYDKWFFGGNNLEYTRAGLYNKHDFDMYIGEGDLVYVQLQGTCRLVEKKDYEFAVCTFRKFMNRTNEKMLLFCQSWNGRENGIVNGRIFEFNCGESFKLIPVLALSGRPAMYDEVSGRLFYNKGTGEFTWGELDAVSANGGGV